MCISGGKDSVILAKLMQELQRHTSQPFELVFMVMDPGYKPENRKLIEDNAALLGIPIHDFRQRHFQCHRQRGEEPLLSLRPGCAGASCMPRLRNWDATRSRWATTFRRHRDHCHGPVLRRTASGHAPQAPQQEFPRHGTDPGPCTASTRTPSSHGRTTTTCNFSSAPAGSRRNGRRRGTAWAAASGQEIKFLLRELKKTNPNIEKSIFQGINGLQLDTFPGFKHRGVFHSFPELYNHPDWFAGETKTEEISGRTLK